MEIQEIKEPVAQRELTAGTETVLVTIGKPTLFDDGGDYYCPYSIEIGDKKKLSYAGGVDSVQAIQLAMKKIGVDLAHLGRKHNTPITWLPDTPDETGFPL